MAPSLIIRKRYSSYLGFQVKLMIIKCQGNLDRLTYFKIKFKMLIARGTDEGSSD